MRGSILSSWLHFCPFSPFFTIVFFWMWSKCSFSQGCHLTFLLPQKNRFSHLAFFWRWGKFYLYLKLLKDKYGFLKFICTWQPWFVKKLWSLEMPVIRKWTLVKPYHVKKIVPLYQIKANTSIPCHKAWFSGFENSNTWKILNKFSL